MYFTFKINNLKEHLRTTKQLSMIKQEKVQGDMSLHLKN